jgi:hypothetical protein
MSENVVRLHPGEVGPGHRLNTDEMLQNTIGMAFTRMAIIGELEGGELHIAGSANAGETLILMELAKRHIVFGD